MSERHIIHVEPANGRGELVVVDVQQDGTHPLDLRLVGCEGESPYVTSIKQRNLASLKHKFKGSDDEWATVLSYFLLQQQPETHQAGILEGVRLVYALKKDNLEISIRQDVQNIKITLGEIILPKDEDFEFNPFEWAQASATAHAHTLQELAGLKLKASSEQDTIAKLNAQLDDFIKTKNETETAMLQKFMELLNEKKRKIRDQSRLLAGAKVDQLAATAIQSSRSDTKPRKAGASRQSKRKAPAQAADADLDADSDSDQMELDQAKEEEQEDEVAATPDHSEDDADEDEAAATPVRAKSSETLRSTSVTRASKEPESDGRPPPKRDLPFGKQAIRTKQPDKQPPPVADDDDDDDDATDDEEL